MSATAATATAPVLAIDAGNTRVKWALRVGGAWTAGGAIATVGHRHRRLRVR